MKRVFIQMNAVSISNSGEFGALQTSANLNVLALHEDNSVLTVTYDIAVPFDPTTVTRAATYEAMRVGLFEKINTDYADWGVNLDGYDVIWSGGDLFFSQPF